MAESRSEPVAEALRLRFHDMTCPEGFTCRDREVHADSNRWVNWHQMAEAAIGALDGIRATGTDGR